MSASAGTRTRDSSLEGLHANPYTTDAGLMLEQRVLRALYLHLSHKTAAKMVISLEGLHANPYTTDAGLMLEQRVLRALYLHLEPQNRRQNGHTGARTQDLGVISTTLCRLSYTTG